MVFFDTPDCSMCNIFQGIYTLFLFLFLIFLLTDCRLSCYFNDIQLVYTEKRQMVLHRMIKARQDMTYINYTGLHKLP